MTSKREHEIFFAALCLWKEARGEKDYQSKVAVVWVIKNRAKIGGWWGDDWISVVCQPYQFSGMTALGDPNTVKFPSPKNKIDWVAWVDACEICQKVYDAQLDDPTNGAVYYHDNRLPFAPKAWGEVQPTAEFGHLKFYRQS